MNEWFGAWMHGCMVLFVAKNLSNYDIIDSVFRYKNCNACTACFLGVPLNLPVLPGLLFQRQRGARAEEESPVQYRREQQRLWDSRPNPRMHGARFHLQLIRLSAILNPGCVFPCFE